MKIQQAAVAAFAAWPSSAGLALHRLRRRRRRRRRRRTAAIGDVAITFLPKNLGNPYFDTSDAGGEEAAEEFGGTVEEVGPDTGDARLAGAVHQHRRPAGRRARWSSRPTTRRRSATRSTRRATPASRWSRSTPTPSPSAATCSSTRPTAEGIAKVQVELISEQIGGAGEIAILSATANATNQNAWIEMMEEELRPNYPDIELVDTVYGDDDDQKSFDKTAALLQSAPGPQGHRLAHDRRHRRRGALPVRRRSTRARSR